MDDNALVALLTNIGHETLIRTHYYEGNRIDVKIPHKNQFNDSLKFEVCVFRATF